MPNYAVAVTTMWDQRESLSRCPLCAHYCSPWLLLITFWLSCKLKIQQKLLSDDTLHVSDVFLKTHNATNTTYHRKTFSHL